MSIEIFLKRHPPVPPLSTIRVRASKIANHVIRRVGAEAGPLLHIPPMTQLAQPGDREIPAVSEVDGTTRRGVGWWNQDRPRRDHLEWG